MGLNINKIAKIKLIFEVHWEHNTEKRMGGRGGGRNANRCNELLHDHKLTMLISNNDTTDNEII